MDFPSIITGIGDVLDSVFGFTGLTDAGVSLVSAVGMALIGLAVIAALYRWARASMFGG